MNIPNYWKFVKIKDICNVETGSTPNTKVKKYWENGSIKWITPTDLSKLNGKITIKDTERKITEYGLRSSSLKLIPRDTIIISSRAPIGYIAVLEYEMTFNQGCKGLAIKNSQEVNSLYLAYQLLSQVDRMQSLGTGSTFKEISKSQISNLSISLPPMAEQQKIAEILSAVDRMIEGVQKAIEKTQRLKKGLMHELLTKGIGHKEFKDTEIGRIPKEWEVVRLNEILGLISGLYFKFSEFNNEGIRCLKIDNVGFGKITWDTITYLPENYLKEYSNLILTKGDIVIALNRPIIDSNVKVGMLTKDDSPSILYQRVGKIVLKNFSKLDKSYLLFFLTGGQFKEQLTHSLIGTDQPYIRTPIFLKIKLPLPPLAEQQKIAEILSTVDQKIELLKSKKEKYEKIKKGLMEDLLTGRRRVKV